MSCHYLAINNPIIIINSLNLKWASDQEVDPRKDSAAGQGTEKESRSRPASQSGPTSRPPTSIPHIWRNKNRLPTRPISRLSPSADSWAPLRPASDH